ncbi:hypothetical protein [Parvularcula marina]|uniref:Uncharacterized protein n=1 Tax=Parvularcula marina TaxID=2292771 RepID=A0A371RH59_9PROT|nr:hypothetical protein [Parvularcula marina]RFB04797.1 hypothetical protein DX908_05575 [Parvularcula marina]
MAGPPLQFFRSLIASDLRSISRNSLLLLLTFTPLLMAVVFRLTVPNVAMLEDLVAKQGYTDIEGLRGFLETALGQIHPVLMSIYIGLSSSLVGSVYGLLLVEEREDHVLPSIRVMPVAFSTYMIARLILPILFSIAVTTLAYPIAGMAPLPLGTIFVIAAAGASMVPMATLAVVAIAPGRVTALAMVRVLSLVAILPILTRFIGPPAEWIFMPIGSYWQMQALWTAIEGGEIGAQLGICVAVNFLFALVFYAIFANKSE